MAKEKTTTRALTGPRQLTSMVENYNGLYNEPDEQFEAQGNWKPIPQVPGTIGKPVGVYSETRIDANLSMDRLTFFPQGIFLQDPGLYEKTPSPVPDDTEEKLMIFDIISTKVLDVGLIAFRMRNIGINNVDGNCAPGMLGSEDDMNQITMGTFRLMARNSQLIQSSSIQATVQTDDFSGAVPFAQDIIYCYRIAMVGGLAFFETRLQIPASRFVIQGIIGQEDDIPYMMRLKNSYELLEKA